MKKFLPGAVALTLLFATSCNKTDDSEATPAALNTWSVGKTTYKTVTVGGGGNVITAANAESGNVITFLFPGKALPTLGGIYAIKNKTEPGTNEAMVVASDKATQGGYMLMSGILTVTIKDGKVVIDLPSTTGKYVGEISKPNEEISAHIEQP
jgi:hypothetical protein